MNKRIQEIFPLGFPWQTADPFLFCVHHLDHYPKGNAIMGPEDSLQGRNLGQDFEIKDGWRMYHGQKVPGFPGHPHRGFETITVVKRGLVDHADSMGAAGRYGNGDVQWMTAGKGVQHSEMFPLLQAKQDNPMELFQIWLNLPAKDKMTEPYFKMFWHEDLPRVHSQDSLGNPIEIEIIAGQYQDKLPLSPPPDSWANPSENEIAIWTIKLGPHAQWTLPAAQQGLNRNLYYYQGGTLKIAGQEIPLNHGVALESDQNIALKNGPEEACLLLLQGRPIGEPVTQYGPFVMNTAAEIQAAFRDYQTSQFGGWPWPEAEVVHGQKQRFAQHADGKVEYPGKADHTA